MLVRSLRCTRRPVTRAVTQLRVFRAPQRLNSSITPPPPPPVQSDETHPSTTNHWERTKTVDQNKCASCGIKLQKTDPSSVGFYTEPKQIHISTSPTHRPYKSKQLQLLSAYSKLDDEGRKLLGTDTLFSKGPLVPDEEAEGRQAEEEEEHLLCQRCHDALHHNVYNPSEHLPTNLTDVLDTIPRGDKIIQVCSAYDFPLSLVPLRGRPDVMYVINKSDMIAPFNKFSRKMRPFLEKVVKRLVGDAKAEVHVVSAPNSWCVNDVLKGMREVNHVLGYVNAGKTMLSKSLRALVQGKRGRIESVGSSHLPALTRENIEHKMAGKTLIDTPGFLEKGGVFPLIQEEKLKRVLAGRKVFIEDLRTTHYESVRGGQCVTVGGLFFLKTPKRSVVQLIPACYGEVWASSSVEKAIATVRDPPEAMRDFFYVKPEAMDDMVRYVIPPFTGTIDLLVKDIGYVQIKPTGAKYDETDLFEVWAPRGVVLGVRETLQHFLTKHLKTTVTKVLKKRGRPVGTKTRTKFAKKKMPTYKIFSRLYEVPKECVNTLDEVKVQYARHLREHGESFYRRKPDEERWEHVNGLWIEKL